MYRALPAGTRRVSRRVQQPHVRSRSQSASNRLKIDRMSHRDLFLEVKRALHPLLNDVRPYRPPEDSLVYESARSQMTNVNIEDELDDHLKIDGLLYSFISLKDLPDATFPGVLRELVVIDFPIVIT